jgi:hypothetical protein
VIEIDDEIFPGGVILSPLPFCRENWGDPRGQIHPGTLSLDRFPVAISQRSSLS